VSRARRAGETPELARLRRRIDRLDRRIVALLNERAGLAIDAGRAKAEAGRRGIRDPEREREVLLRVSMANDGPLPQATLLALYRRLMAATRELEAADRSRERSGGGAHAGQRSRGGAEAREERPPEDDDHERARPKG
jgi:chorismate mutase/prephenate dehydratase